MVHNQLKNLRRMLCVLFFALMAFNVSMSGATERIPSVRFLVFSDPHLSIPAANTRSTDTKMEHFSDPLFQSALDDSKRWEGARFALVLGDLTKDAEPWNIDRIAEMLADVHVPTYCLLGNHDVSPIPPQGKDPQLKHKIGTSKHVITWALQGKGFKGPSGYYSVDPVPGVHLIALDTTKVDDWGGKVPAEQLRWLEKDLQKNKGKFTIVIGHHGLVPFDKRELQNPDWANFYLDNRDEVLKILEKFKDVQYYLWGHRHVSNSVVERNGIKHIVNATTLTYPMRYSVYDLTPQTLSYQTVDVPFDSTVWENAKKFMSLDKWQGPVDGKDPESILEYVERNESRNATMKNR